MDQWQRILQCLQHIQDGNPEAISRTEAQLDTESKQAGYGVVLSQVAINSQVESPLRQLAAVLLKQYVKQHWVEGERGFQPPETSEHDKQQIRQALPSGLMDADSKIRTAVGMAIAAIANWDWPQAWPGLMDFIVNSIKDRRDTHLLMGCLRCLGVMASDLDSEQAPQLLQALSPELAGIVSSPNTPANVSATCFSIMAELASALGALSGAYQRQVRDMLVPLMQPWVPIICGALSSTVQERSSWPIKHAALRLSQGLVTYASKQLESSMPQLMGATWQLLLAAQPLHQSMLVEGADDENDDETAEGEEDHVGLEALVAQLFELLLSFVGPPRFRQQLAAGIPQMTYVAIAYLQMTKDQAESWAANVNQFVADEEEDIVSCRASAELLLCELADEFGAAALPALLEGVGTRLAEADAAAAAGHSSWWSMREAAIMAVGACCEQFEAAVMSRAVPAQQLQQLLDMLLQRDLQPLLQQQQHVQLGDEGQQFVLGRALWVGSKLCRVATTQQREAFLQAAARAVMTNTSSSVTVNAFRALTVLCPAVPAQQLQPLLQPLLAALVQLLTAAGEEGLHLVLEVLAAVIKAATPEQQGGAAAVGGLMPEQAMAVAGPVLQAWIAHTSDPLIGPDAQDVIAAIASQPACLPSLAAAAAPTLAGILSRGAAARQAKRQGVPVLAAEPGQDGPMLVEASLDLLGTLVNPGQEAVAAELCRGVLWPVLSLIQASDDPSELTSAVTLLMQLLRTCPVRELLSCSTGAPSGSQDSKTVVLSQILTATRQLLSPAQPDSCSRDAGPLLVQLLKTFPAELAAAPPAAVTATAGSPASPSSYVALLLHDVCCKLATGACSPATALSLLEFVVRVALIDVQQLAELLASIHVQQRGGTVTSGLAVVLPLWLEHAPDFSGSLLTRQNAAALMQLLQLRHHPVLSGLMVQGVPIEDVGAAACGRVTRSRAKQQGGLKYSQVPVPVKVVHVLGQILAADAEGDSSGRRLPGHEASDEEEDWEDDSEEGSAGGHAAAVEGLGKVQLVGQRVKGLSALMSPDGDVLDMLDISEANTPLPEDPADANDPLLRSSLKSLLRQGLSSLVSADPGFMSAAAAQLGGGRELQALQQLLSTANVGGGTA